MAPPEHETDSAVFQGVEAVAAATIDGAKFTAWDEVVLERVIWLMRDRLPFGELTIVEGDGGLGKTTAMLDIAARVSRGLPMPDGTPNDSPLDVLLVAEEDRASILKARLIAAGADMRRIHRLEKIDGERLSFPTHTKAFFAQVVRLSARFVLIDALFNHFDSGLKTNLSEDVRKVLEPLSEVAHSSGAVITGIRHWGKTSQKASTRGLGSSEIRNVARSTLVVGRSPSDESVRVIALDKSNLGADSSSVQSLTFKLEPLDVTEGSVTVQVAKVVWGNLSELNADDLANTVEESGEKRTRIAYCVEQLREALADGKRPAQDVQAELEALGFQPSLIFNARKKAGVSSEPVPGSFPRKTIWSLPSPALALARDYKINNSSSSTESTHAREASTRSTPNSVSNRARESTGRSTGGMRCRSCGVITIVRLPDQVCDTCAEL